MLFQFNRWNHCRQGQIIVEDITRIMSAQLQALGHEAATSEGPFVGGDLGYNVVLEAFEDQAHVQAIADARGDGCRFIIVATEEPSDEGFNGGFDPGMRRRQDAFPAAAKHADAILHLVPGAQTTAWYSRFAPTAAVELGHAPSLVESGEDRPEFDFGFFGKMTWRRRAMLDRLGPSILVIETLDVPRAERDAMMRRCRVVVQILAEQTPEGVPCGMVSSTRCASALLFGRPVVGEPHPNPEPWDKVVHFAPSIDRFFEDAVVACRMWQACHRQQFEMFERLLTPEVCLGAPLRSIGII